MGKSFKKNLNPALQFINTASESERTQAEKSEAERSAENSPASAAAAPAAVKYGETKSRRLQLLLRPSAYARLAALAAERRVSVNEMANILLEAAAPDCSPRAAD